MPLIRVVGMFGVLNADTVFVRLRTAALMFWTSWFRRAVEASWVVSRGVRVGRAETRGRKGRRVLRCMVLCFGSSWFWEVGVSFETGDEVCRSCSKNGKSSREMEKSLGSIIGVIWRSQFSLRHPNGLRDTMETLSLPAFT